MSEKSVTTTGTQQAAPKRQGMNLFDAMRNDLEHVFDRFERGWPFLGRNGHLTYPGQAGPSMMDAALDVRDEGQQIVIEADLPGVEDKDVTVTVADGVLTIKGERRSQREEKQDDYHLAERSFGKFERALRLPDTVDETQIEAKFDKGVLHVTARKRPDAVKSERKIEIKKA
ncbi:MAG: Hsp20/alpha crystallin family protein [Hyphomicrobiaceae bacterium]